MRLFDPVGCFDQVANLSFSNCRFRHHKAMIAAAAASTAPTSHNTSFASTESYPYESFDESG